MTLKQKVISGTKWIAVANVFKQVLQVLSLLVFSRLLSPDDFGIYAVMMIFVTFLGLFSDMGTASAIIQIDSPSAKLLSSVFYFNIAIGAVLFVGLTAASSLIASFFDMALLSQLMPTIAFNFIITSFGVVQKALYEKKLDFKRITLIESFSVLFGTVVGISCAYIGMGVYSLVVHTLATSILLVLLMWYTSSWRPIIYFSMGDIKSIWGYTANLSAFNFINYFARNADNFLIGKFIGSSGLGVYSLAYKIMLYPLQNISGVFIRILFPAFSTIKYDNEKFKRAYKKVLFFIAIVSFPLMAGLFATADIFVAVVFGEKWSAMVDILIILTPIGLMQSIVTTVGSIYMAKGNTSMMFKIGTINAVVTVTSFGIGVFFGTEGVAISYLIANIIMLYPNLLVAWKQIDLKVSEGLMVMLPIFLISIVMVLLVFALGSLLHCYAMPESIKLFIMIIMGIGVYMGLLHLKYGNLKKLFAELRN